ncbi:hypothetical protein AX774_g4827 [Zancudomyces culisetae]|uniref:Uncharacterized protein n=1 Tax=Zancudomyces culisetae TaxID=1213189 RepID=A0A1R1PL58_ZANCU|nr:hypothetical protein AX774_g4827 [Zancudomyces culisetae]|eukprot:OMH81711.1 hypothetical protein AX774_g4827 [Zancudomyces culisetae]
MIPKYYRHSSAVLTPIPNSDSSSSQPEANHPGKLPSAKYTATYCSKRKFGFGLLSETLGTKKIKRYLTLGFPISQKTGKNKNKVNKRTMNNGRISYRSKPKRKSRAVYFSRISSERRRASNKRTLHVVGRKMYCHENKNIEKQKCRKTPGQKLLKFAETLKLLVTACKHTSEYYSATNSINMQEYYKLLQQNQQITSAGDCPLIISNIQLDDIKENHTKSNNCTRCNSNVQISTSKTDSMSSKNHGRFVGCSRCNPFCQYCGKGGDFIKTMTCGNGHTYCIKCIEYKVNLAVKAKKKVVHCGKPERCNNYIDVEQAITYFRGQDEGREIYMAKESGSLVSTLHSAEAKSWSHSYYESLRKSLKSNIEVIGEYASVGVTKCSKQASCIRTHMKKHIQLLKSNVVGESSQKESRKNNNKWKRAIGTLGNNSVVLTDNNASENKKVSEVKIANSISHVDVDVTSKKDIDIGALKQIKMLEKYKSSEISRKGCNDIDQEDSIGNKQEIDCGREYDTSRKRVEYQILFNSVEKGLKNTSDRGCAVVKKEKSIRIAQTRSSKQHNMSTSDSDMCFDNSYICNQRSNAFRFNGFRLKSIGTFKPRSERIRQGRLQRQRVKRNNRKNRKRRGKRLRMCKSLNYVLDKKIKKVIGNGNGNGNGSRANRSKSAICLGTSSSRLLFRKRYKRLLLQSPILAHTFDSKASSKPQEENNIRLHTGLKEADLAINTTRLMKRNSVHIREKNLSGNESSRTLKEYHEDETDVSSTKTNMHKSIISMRTEYESNKMRVKAYKRNLNTQKENAQNERKGFECDDDFHDNNNRVSIISLNDRHKVYLTSIGEEYENIGYYLDLLNKEDVEKFNSLYDPIMPAINMKNVQRLRSSRKASIYNNFRNSKMSNSDKNLSFYNSKNAESNSCNESGTYFRIGQLGRNVGKGEGKIDSDKDWYNQKSFDRGGGFCDEYDEKNKITQYGGHNANFFLPPAQNKRIPNTECTVVKDQDVYKACYSVPKEESRNINYSFKGIQAQAINKVPGINNFEKSRTKKTTIKIKKTTRNDRNKDQDTCIKSNHDLEYISISKSKTRLNCTGTSEFPVDTQRVSNLDAKNNDNDSVSISGGVAEGICDTLAFPLSSEPSSHDNIIPCFVENQETIEQRSLPLYHEAYTPMKKSKPKRLFLSSRNEKKTKVLAKPPNKQETTLQPEFHSLTHHIDLKNINGNSRNNKNNISNYSTGSTSTSATAGEGGTRGRNEGGLRWEDLLSKFLILAAKYTSLENEINHMLMGNTDFLTTKTVVISKPLLDTAEYNKVMVLLRTKLTPEFERQEQEMIEKMAVGGVEGNRLDEWKGRVEVNDMAALEAEFKLEKYIETEKYNRMGSEEGEKMKEEKVSNEGEKPLEYYIRLMSSGN